VSMFKSWRLGRLLGFPVEINLSFLLLLALVFVWFGGLAGVLTIGLVFASVLVHELGHAVVARHLGVRVLGIELGFLGGAAKMVDMPRRPEHEIAIAAAGPVVSLVIAGIGLGLGSAIGSSYIAMIGWINLVLAAFNLIPALPMDGGRILRAVLARRMSFVRATDISVTVSRVVAVGFGILGLLGAYQLLVLAPFLWLMGTRERMMARLVADPLVSPFGRFAETATDDEVEVLGRGAWERRRTSPPPGPFGGLDAFGPFGPFPFGPTGNARRFTIQQHGGRLVIVAID
jgi:Zn-dependent protease